MFRVMETDVNGRGGVSRKPDVTESDVKEEVKRFHKDKTKYTGKNTMMDSVVKMFSMKKSLKWKWDEDYDGVTSC